MVVEVDDDASVESADEESALFVVLVAVTEDEDESAAEDGDSPADDDPGVVDDVVAGVVVHVGVVVVEVGPVVVVGWPGIVVLVGLVGLLDVDGCVLDEPLPLPPGIGLSMALRTTSGGTGVIGSGVTPREYASAQSSTVRT